MTGGAVAAVVLAAGFSRRMGKLKPLLPIHGKSPLQRCVELFREAGVDDVRVVTGYRGEELAPHLERLGVLEVRNPHYRQGMFSSVRAGLATAGEGIEAVFVLPADIPLVRPATVRRLMEAFFESGREVVHPSFLGERGHPPLIGAQVARRIAAARGDGGLRGELALLEEGSLSLEVADGNILLDMDSPEDLPLLEERARRMAIPSLEECGALMTRVLSLDERIVRHGRAVAKVALRLALELKRAGCEIDAEMLEAAALLHDIAKGRAEHGAAGARLLVEHGFLALAPAVALHMGMEKEGDGGVGVAELLFLADRMVDGEEIVPMEERFRRKMERHRDDPPVLGIIEARLRSALTVRERVESLMGRSLEEVLMDRDRADNGRSP